MKELQIVKIEGVECYEKDGTAYLKLESVAKGLGFTEVKNGKDYVMWRRVDGFLQDLGFGTCAERPEFIPENIFYRLAMKAKNETAERFQAKVADEIIPSIRKHGAYMTEDTIQKALNSPDFLIQLATKLKDEQERNKRLEQEKKVIEAEAVKMNKAIADMKPKADYVDIILQSKSTVLTTQIAQDYGMSAKAFNKKLEELGIQHKVGGQWILYAKYLGKGYVQSKTIEFTRSNGVTDTRMQTEWTTKGRMFLYEELKNHGVYPMIERAA